MSTEGEIHQHITELIGEEHQLRSRLGSGEISVEAEHERLHAVETQLDQAWDLLRQREALRNAGGNPDNADVRPARVVEGYQG
ncbi:MAG: DUF2630 family protein [Antricoccus sp.]